MSEGIDELKVLAAQQPELQMMQGIVENLSDPIVTVRMDYSIIYINQQAEMVFGWKRKELIGQHINVLIPDPLKAAHLEHLEEFRNHPHARSMMGGRELTAKRKDGSEIKCFVKIEPIVTDFDCYVSAQIRVL